MNYKKTQGIIWVRDFPDGSEYIGINPFSKSELLYARHKLRAGKCHFRSARKRAMNEQLNDGN